MATESLIDRRAARWAGISRRLDVVAVNPRYAAICRHYCHTLPYAVQRRIKVWSFDRWEEISWDQIKRCQAAPLLVISRLADIPEDATVVRGIGHRDRKHLLFVEDMPVEAISSRVPRLNIRDAQRLHIARERNPQRVSAIIGRAIEGIAWGKERRTIVDAWVEDDYLVVLFSAFERIKVPLSKLSNEMGTGKGAIRAFEIDEDGSFLYWPHADVHLGPDQLHAMVDPTSAVVLGRKSRRFDREYGQAIRALREERRLNQTAIEGVTDRHLRRIEHGQLAPTSGVLECLAKAHGMDICQYMAELAKRLA
jgi:hypothetical protein